MQDDPRSVSRICGSDFFFLRVASRKGFFILLVLSILFTFPRRRLEPRKSPIIAEEIIKKPEAHRRDIKVEEREGSRPLSTSRYHPITVLSPTLWPFSLFLSHDWCSIFPSFRLSRIIEICSRDIGEEKWRFTLANTCYYLRFIYRDWLNCLKQAGSTLRIPSFSRNCTKRARQMSVSVSIYIFAMY